MRCHQIWWLSVWGGELLVSITHYSSTVFTIDALCDIGQQFGALVLRHLF